MGRILILVILFLVFKSIYRFITEVQGQKGGGIPHPLPSRHARPGIPREQGAEAHEHVLSPLPEDDKEERIKKGLYPSEHGQTSEDTSMLQQTNPDERGQDDSRKEGDTILPHFGLKEGHAVILQGIILAEILGPPVSRRRRLIPPYLRG